jgi:hypothetical protein
MMTLGNAAAAQVRLIVWCKGRGNRTEPDPADMAERPRPGLAGFDLFTAASLYGADTTVPDRRERLLCSRCGSREVDMVVTGTELR